MVQSFATMLPYVRVAISLHCLVLFSTFQLTNVELCDLSVGERRQAILSAAPEEVGHVVERFDRVDLPG